MAEVVEVTEDLMVGDWCQIDEYRMIDLVVRRFREDDVIFMAEDRNVTLKKHTEHWKICETDQKNQYTLEGYSSQNVCLKKNGSYLLFWHQSYKTKELRIWCRGDIREFLGPTILKRHYFDQPYK
eukprot:UN27156